MANKRILIVTQYFYPENFKSTDLGVELVKRGYEVDALVGIPNYPEGVYFKGYGLFHKRKESYQGVNIYRVLQLPRGRKASAIGIALNYFSFVISGSLWAIWFALFKKKYDKIIVFQVSPILQAIPAIVYKKLKGTPILHWVLDVWPESMTSVHKPSKWMVRSVSKIVDSSYKNAHRILISSKPMRESVLKHGHYEDKIVYFPNWCDEMKPVQKDLPTLLEGEFVFMMAGTLAYAQIYPSFLDALKRLSVHKEIKWVFVGEGSQRPILEQFIKDNHLEDVAQTVGKYPFDYMYSFFKKADVLLLTLSEGRVSHQMTVPGRFQSYMSMGKPILVFADDGASSQLLQEANCGFSATTTDELVSVVEEKILGHKDELKSLGENGKVYFDAHFTKDICFDHLEKLLEE